MNQLPKILNYGKYSSSNYGVNTLAISFEKLTIYYSYETPVAFTTPDMPGVVCRQNDWAQTTGKHLNWIEPNKKNRIPGEEFEAKLAELLKSHGLIS